MILDPNGDHAKPELSVVTSARVLNEVTREDITFTVYPRNAEGVVRVVGMLNIGSAQQYNPVDHPDATEDVLNGACMDSICRGAGNRIYGKVRSDALTATTEILKLLNRTVGVTSEEILCVRALLEPLVEAGGDLSGPSE